MKKMIRLLLIFLLIISLQDKAHAQSFDNRILMVEPKYTFTIKFNKPLISQQFFNNYVMILDEREEKLKSKAYLSSPDTIKIEFKEDFDPTKIYRVVVKPGILSIEGGTLKESVQKKFLPNYTEMMNMCERRYYLSRESAKYENNTYKIGSREVFKDKLDNIRASYIAAGTSISEERKLELVGQLQRAAIDFEHSKWRGELFKSGDIQLIIGDDYQFSFNVKYDEITFKNDLENFRAILYRDKEPFYSATIPKTDYTNLSPLKGIVEYNNRNEFENILTANDIPYGAYTMKVFPIYKGGTIEESTPSEEKEFFHKKTF